MQTLSHKTLHPCTNDLMEPSTDKITTTYYYLTDFSYFCFEVARKYYKYIQLVSHVINWFRWYITSVG